MGWNFPSVMGSRLASAWESVEVAFNNPNKTKMAVMFNVFVLFVFMKLPERFKPSLLE